jgi:hypothetical protein
MEVRDTYLKYIGQGASLPGVPARNLTRDEVDQLDENKLIQSGLYVKVAIAGGSNKMSAGPKSNKSLVDSDEKE